MATFFYFLGQLFSGQLFELFARETNLKKQSSVNGFSFGRAYAPQRLKNQLLYYEIPLFQEFNDILGKIFKQ